MNTGFSLQMEVKQSGILSAAPGGRPCSVGVYMVCGSKGDNVRLGQVQHKEHKPIRIKGLLVVRNQREVSALCLPQVEVRSSQCPVGFDLPRTASRSTPR